MTGWPAYFVSGRNAMPPFVGICACGCVFPHEGDNKVSLVPVVRCPECNSWVALTERHPERPSGVTT